MNAVFSSVRYACLSSTTLTPFPPACLAGFRTTFWSQVRFLPASSSALSADPRSLKVLKRSFPGRSYFHWSLLRAAFERSMTERSLDAPTHGIPARQRASGTPWKFGSSGPVIAMSTPSLLAVDETNSGSVVFPRISSPPVEEQTSSIPGFLHSDIQYILGSWRLDAIFSIKACSLEPPPIPRTLIIGRHPPGSLRSNACRNACRSARPSSRGG